MPESPEPRFPLLGLGMTSLILGVIGLMLSLLPVLGIPISVLGLFFGLVGLLGVFFGVSSLRWSIGGIGVCSLALLVNLALTYAPGGYVPDPKVPRIWQPVYDRPYVSPPAL